MLVKKKGKFTFSTVKNPGVKGEGSPWGNFEKLGENFCEQSEQSWGNFLRAKRAVVGNIFASEASSCGEIFASEAITCGGNYCG